MTKSQVQQILEKADVSFLSSPGVDKVDREGRAERISIDLLDDLGVNTLSSGQYKKLKILLTKDVGEVSIEPRRYSFDVVSVDISPDELERFALKHAKRL